MKFIHAFCLAILCATAWFTPAFAAPPSSTVSASFDPQNVYVFAPKSMRTEPQQVVVALHGMEMDGRGFCQGLLATAERNGWIVVAPTFSFRDWRDPKIVAEDDVALTDKLIELLETLPDRIGHPVDQRVFLVGFSRGAQLAHRFAFAHPERTRGVAAISAGTYTMPIFSIVKDDREIVLPFPFGIANLASLLAIPERPSINYVADVQASRDLTGRTSDSTDSGNGIGMTEVPFWIAIGAEDRNPDDVPRQWDALFGKSRVERAMRFGRALQSGGFSSELTIFPGVGHVLSADMTRGAIAFMERIESGRPIDPARLSMPEIVAAPVAI